MSNKETKDQLIGKKVFFPDDNDMFFFQDFSGWEGIPSHVVFTITDKTSNGEYWLTSFGYGDLESEGGYGNGKIAVKREDIEKARELMKN